jgi:anti-sigma factor RsiW
MNCLEFRRLVLVDPRGMPEDARAHAAACAACRETLEKQREADDRLFDALQVPVPDGLADRILVARGQRPARRRFAWAIAATLLVTAGAGLIGRRYLFPPDPLGAEAIDHVAHEPQSFTTIHTVGNDYLPAVLAEQGLKAALAIGQVTYTRICPMDGRTARHLVIRTAEGPVTLFLMPDDPNKRRRSVTEAGGMAAVTMPAAKGSVAIVATSLAQAVRVEKSLVA